MNLGAQQLLVLSHMIKLLFTVYQLTMSKDIRARSFFIYCYSFFQ